MRALVATAILLIALPARGDDSPELVVIVHPQRRDSVGAQDLEAMFLRRVNHWSDGDMIVPINAPAGRAARVVFDRVVLGMEPDEVARYWLDQRIRAGVGAPREVADPALVVRLVARLEGAIAYVPGSADVRGVRVVARIRGGKLVSP